MDTHTEEANMDCPLPDPEQALSNGTTESEAWRKRLDTLLLISEETFDSMFSTQKFQRIADALLQSTGFCALSAKLFDERNQTFSMVAHRGLPSAMVTDMKCCPLRSSRFLTDVARTRQPLYTLDHTATPALRGKWIDLLGLRSTIFVPLLFGPQFIGALVLISTKPVILNSDDITWLTAVGKQLGAIVHRTSFAEQVKVSAALEERTRLGREMHDGPSQVLGYLNMKLQIAQKLISSGKTVEAMDELRHLEEVSAQAYDQVRDVIFDLRVSPFLDQNLMTTLDKYVEEYGLRSRIEVSVDTKGWTNPALAPEVQLQVMCILQEVLANVRKHANAKHVWVTGKSHKTAACVHVKDDGCGFDVAKTRRFGDCRHWGLQTMCERAESIGGVLRIRSEVEHGTEVEICFPVIQD